MKRRYSLVAVATIYASFVACNALTGVGDLGVDDAVTTDAAAPAYDSAPPSSASSSSSSSTSSSGSAGGSSTSSSSSTSTSSSTSGSSSTSTSSSTSSSGSPIVDAGSDAAAAPVTLLSEGFESVTRGATSCDGWTLVGDDPYMGVDDVPHSGNNSCELCADEGEALLQKTVVVPSSGKVKASAWVAGEGISTPYEIGLASDGSSASTTGTATGESYAEASGVTVPVAAGASVTVTVGITKGTTGSCVEVDDILVTVQ